MASNADLLKRAYHIFPGASLGTFYLPEGHEFVIQCGQGSRVWDVEGNVYLDYVMGSGPMVLGHAHPVVVAAVQRQIEHGSTFYGLNDVAIRLGEKIVTAAPCAEAIKVCGSGAEATFYALRLARTATGRPKVLKFEGGYHGHHDYAMMSVTPARLVSFPTPVPDSAGIPEDVERQVLVAPFNDLTATAEIIRRHRDELAAVIIEPLNRMLEPTPGFLEGLRQVTREIGAILIFDEVVTGFRVAWGGAQGVYGVTPDLATYGKIIGGGLPLAAVVGRRDEIEFANPRKKGAPDYLVRERHPQRQPAVGRRGPGDARGAGARGDLRPAERGGRGAPRRPPRHRQPARDRGAGARARPARQHLLFAHPITDYRSSLKADSRTTQQLGSGLLARGVLTNLAAKMYLRSRTPTPIFGGHWRPSRMRSARSGPGDGSPWS
jgi:glutamate-1-semialdehyde 2,1-aminomutase